MGPLGFVVFMVASGGRCYVLCSRLDENPFYTIFVSYYRWKSDSLWHSYKLEFILAELKLS